ncbi:MAG: MogA/MoaB family molybdenum cofactor biosynthesis protein [Gemmatimonadota bacterium]
MTADREGPRHAEPRGAVRVAALTVSDGVVSGHREDLSGRAIAEWADARGHALVDRNAVADEVDRIRAVLESWTASGSVDLILTTGGTGFTARDVTPEATAPLIERDAPGLADAIRRLGAKNTPYAILSRGLAGIRGRTLIVNLPGGTGGVRDGLAVLDEVLHHAVDLLRGERTDHTA